MKRVFSKLSGKLKDRSKCGFIELKKFRFWLLVFFFIKCKYVSKVVHASVLKDMI